MDPSEFTGLQKLIWEGLLGIWGYGEDSPVYIVGAVLCVVIPYLLGSINFAVIFSRGKFHEDIREHGSGNGFHQYAANLRIEIRTSYVRR